MKTFILAALVAATFGLGAAGAANAANWRATSSHPANGNQYNWMAGGGG
jgi:hypothetical protein